MSDDIKHAISVLQDGGVIAYPTEFCFGLGCDPANGSAIQRILEIKQRTVEQGVILIAANVLQVEEYAELNADSLAQDIKQEILASWPGPVTWLLPAKQHASTWIRGEHSSIAMRVTAHALSNELCSQFGGAIVSTSANRHGQPALTKAQAVVDELGSEVDYVIDSSVGVANSKENDNDRTQDLKASQIRDAITGKRLR